MQRSRLPLTLALIAFGLALVSGGYAYNRLIKTVPALIVVQDVGPGTELTPHMVEVIRIPAGGVPPRALYGPGQITGQYARYQLLADQILTTRHLSSEPPARDPLQSLGPEQRALTIPLKPEVVAAGSVKPGDLVDLAAAWPGPEGKPGAVEVLAPGVRVLDLRDAGGKPVTAGGKAAAAVVAVSAAQAKSLTGAMESRAAIHLWLAGRDPS